MAHFLSCILVCSFIVQTGLAIPFSIPDIKPGQLGAVSSEAEICSRIGTRLLQKGGNAADAAVGTILCVGVVGNYHEGLGGGGSMLVRSAAGEYEFIDFRETAPGHATQDMFSRHRRLSLAGGLASGVPGELRGLQYLHEKYGKLPWEDVVRPATYVAKYGWQVNDDLEDYFYKGMVMAGSRFLIDDPEFAKDYAPNGKLLQKGQTIRLPRLAATLETIAKEGPDAFYEGPIAVATVRAVQAKGGIITLEDMKKYKVLIRKPSSITYRGYKLTACSAPTGGTVALSVLKTMEGYDNVGDPQMKNQTTHRLDEAIRWAYSQRARIGDPSFVPGLHALEEAMLSEEEAERIRSMIDDNQAFGIDHYEPGGFESTPSHGTSQVVVADHTGLAISSTTTLNLLWGSTVMVPETGVVMNNNMDDFSVPGIPNFFGYKPAPANYIRPGKRPLSSVSPIIIERLLPTSSPPFSKFYAAIGASGGSRIVTATVQNILHILDGGLSVYEALAQPRMHDQLIPSVTTFEWAFDNKTVAYMADLGHNVTRVTPGLSAAQGLRMLPNGTFEAAGEPRQKNSGGFAV